MRFREVPFIQDDPNAGPEVKHATVTPTARAIHIDVTDWCPTPVCLKKSKLWFNHFHPWFSRKLVVRRKNSKFLSISVNTGKWLQIWKFYVKTHIDIQTVCLKNKTWFVFTWNCWNIFEVCKGIMLRFPLSLSRPQ